MKKYKLVYLEEAKEAAPKLSPIIKPLIKAGLESLSSNPYKGKELAEELNGYSSMAISKYRVIYEIIEDSKTVEINLIGHRRDVYANFKNMLDRAAASIH